MNEPNSDGVVIRQVLQGDRNAFRTLVERYHGMVYHVAYGMCRNAESAQDAVQEVFYRAFKRLEQFKPEQTFGAWVRRITVNYMLDQYKKKKLPTESMVNPEGETREFADDPELTPREELLTQDRDETILAAIQELPDKYKAILILRHFEDLSYEEIAQEVELPLGTVTTQLHRARNMLAQRLNWLQSDYAFGE
ncbi:MAG: sigma-70 family RNA polymerase sigma factor [Candidatus Hinthialibacter antarcticus]|nr:sigma-70 family RNA polymerase sigma factor [Candidatus Hinthialibacter antarcticus]